MERQNTTWKQNVSRCQVQYIQSARVIRPFDIIVSSAVKHVKRITYVLRNEIRVDTLSGRAYVTAVVIPSLFVSGSLGASLQFSGSRFSEYPPSSRMTPVLAKRRKLNKNYSESQMAAQCYVISWLGSTNCTYRTNLGGLPTLHRRVNNVLVVERIGTFIAQFNPVNLNIITH